MSAITDNKSDFIDSWIDYTRRICEDSYKRMQGAGVDSNRLNSGIWYGGYYYNVLKRSGKADERIKWLRERNAFYNGYTSSNLIQKPIQKKVFVVIKNASTSEALDDLNKCLGIMECGLVLRLSMSLAIRDYIGKDKFDHLFAQNAFCLTSKSQFPLDRLMNMHFLKRSSDIQVGDSCYIASTELYRDKHPLGQASGYHALCIESMSERKYLAFGLPGTGSTQEEIEQDLLEDFNNEPVSLESLEPTLKEQQKLVHELLFSESKGWKFTKAEFDASSPSSKKDLKELAEQYNLPVDVKLTDGKLALQVRRINLIALNLLKEATKENIRDVFEKFQSEIVHEYRS